jgi:hypothetical protein
VHRIPFLGFVFPNLTPSLFIASGETCFLESVAFSSPYPRWILFRLKEINQTVKNRIQLEFQFLFFGRAFRHAFPTPLRVR